MRSWGGPLAVAIVLGLFAGSAWGQQNDPAPVLAVFLIESRGSPLSDEELVALTDYLGTKLGEQGQFQIIPREEIRRRLVRQKRASYKSCYDKECQIEVGRELAAQFSVSASISRVGTTCIITSAMYNLKKAATYRTATAKAACGADALLVAVEEIGAKLTGEVAAPPPKPPPPAQKAPGVKVVKLPNTISVCIQTEPKGAEVVMDGRRQGESPVYVAVTPGQKYALVVSKDGYQTIDKDVVFHGPERMNITMKMTAERIRSLEQNRTEWLAWYLGVSLAGGEVAVGESLSLFTLKWEHFFWTIMDTVVSIGSMGEEDTQVTVAYFTRAGYPIYLGDRSQHQIRPSLGLGMCLSPGSSDNDPSFCISPSLSYVYQTGGWYHIGFILSTTITMDSRQGFPMILSLATPLGWTGSRD